MFIPTPGKSPVKTGDRRSDLGLSLLLGVPHQYRGFIVQIVMALLALIFEVLEEKCL